jgi:hypothetical protein
LSHQKAVQRNQPIPERFAQSCVLHIQFARKQQHRQRGVRRDLVQLRANQRFQLIDWRLGSLQRRCPGRCQRTSLREQRGAVTASESATSSGSRQSHRA